MSRFLTDPDCGATEKLSISSPVPGSMQGVQPLAPTDIQSDGTMVGPMSLLFVKGWTRSLAATVVMMCCFENEEFLKARHVLILVGFYFLTLKLPCRS